ncbi:EamA/RhaT family transporter [Bacteroidota bacterium]
MKNRTPLFAILLVVVCTFLTSFGQYFIKLGTAEISGTLISILNAPLIGGFVLYALGAVLLIIALKYGELSVLYPFIALSFVWVFLLSNFMLHEAIILINWLGLVLIIFGVSFIGWGANQ